MSLIQVKGAIVKCSHGGRLKLAKGDARLTVDGKPTLLDEAKGTTAGGAGPSTWSVPNSGQQKTESTR